MEGVGAGGSPVDSPVLGHLGEELAGGKPLEEIGVGRSSRLRDVAPQHPRTQLSGIGDPHWATVAWW